MPSRYGSKPEGEINYIDEWSLKRSPQGGAVVLPGWKPICCPVGELWIRWGSSGRPAVIECKDMSDMG